MFHFVFRTIGLLVLALALVLAVLDITRSITASSMILTPLGTSWAAINPQSLESSKQAVETLIHPFLWDPVIMFALKLPSWLVFCFLALVLMWLGQKREDPFGRFASR